MKYERCTEEKEGFFGLFCPAEKYPKAALILPSDDNADDHLAKSELKWAHSLGISAVTISPDKKENGLHDWPIEHVESAVRFLQGKGYGKIGIFGLSSGSLIALTAASLLPDITLTIALTPVDFILGGYLHDNLDGADERPAEGESTFTRKGERLPYVSAPYAHPEYWNKAKEEAKRRGDMIAAKELYEETERRHPVQEEAFIKVENIRGHLFLAASEDDVLWPACKYIRRMEHRLEERDAKCTREIKIYAHATHFIFPDRLIRCIVPGFLVNLVLPLVFRESRGYLKECRATRKDLDRRIEEMIAGWAA